MKEHCYALLEILNTLPVYSGPNVSLLKDLHEKYDAVLLDIKAENEEMAKPFITASYDTGKWIASAQNSKKNVQKAWFDMAATNLNKEIKALREKLVCG